MAIYDSDDKHVEEKVSYDERRTRRRGLPGRSEEGVGKLSFVSNSRQEQRQTRLVPEECREERRGGRKDGQTAGEKGKKRLGESG